MSLRYLYLNINHLYYAVVKVNFTIGFYIYNNSNRKRGDNFFKNIFHMTVFDRIVVNVL